MSFPVSRAFPRSTVSTSTLGLLNFVAHRYKRTYHSRESQIVVRAASYLMIQLLPERVFRFCRRYQPHQHDHHAKNSSEASGHGQPSRLVSSELIFTWYHHHGGSGGTDNIETTRWLDLTSYTSSLNHDVNSGTIYYNSSSNRVRLRSPCRLSSPPRLRATLSFVPRFPMCTLALQRAVSRLLAP